MNKLTDEIYWYFYGREYITPQEMANLICNNDPRNGSLKSNHDEYKKVYQRIRDAVKRSDIKFEGSLKVNSKVVSKDIFFWAIYAYTSFGRKLPQGMIVINGKGNIRASSSQVNGFSVFIPSDISVLKQKCDVSTLF